MGQDTNKPLNFRKFPSTTALQCFETAARHLSFTKAAQEMHMTQSAVSKQVAQLEDMLQIPLFYRTSQGICLTPAGKSYYIDALAVLKHLEKATINLMSHGGLAETLDIVSHPTFCARWLIPVLKGFSQQYPLIHLDIKEQVGPFFSEEQGVDVAFLYGDGVWSGMAAQKLFDEYCVAVCRPDYIAKPLESLTDLHDYVLLQSSSRPSAWYEYFNQQKAMMKDTFVGPRFDTFYACITAAQIGCGIALVPLRLVTPELRSGELILAWPHLSKGRGAYYMTYPYAKAQMPKVTTLIQWINTYIESSDQLQSTLGIPPTDHQV